MEKFVKSNENEEIIKNLQNKNKSLEITLKKLTLQKISLNFPIFVVMNLGSKIVDKLRCEKCFVEYG